MVGMKRLREKFIPGKTRVHYSGGWFDEAEIKAMVEVAKSGWLGAGVVTEKFEKKLAKYIGGDKTLATNSGSSATLLCMAALTSRLRPDPLKPSDEVVTPPYTTA